MRSLVLSIIFLLSAGSYASCFTEHVREGRSLNLKRKRSYEILAQKYGLREEAKKASRALVSLENLMIPFARYYDYRAKKYADINLFCDEFVDISLSPDFTNKPVSLPKYPFVKKLDSIKKYKKQVRKYSLSFQWEKIRELSHELVESLPNKETHCLQRHFVESIGRIAYLAPEKIISALELKLKNPKRLISSMIRLHLMGFSYAQTIDAKAFPLQKVGIPIVCQDIPPIIF